MSVIVSFYSYFRELTGCGQVTQTVPEKSTLDDLYRTLAMRFPKLGAMQKSTLMAVGVEYRERSYVLNDGDEVSLFPPVQGG
jgi:molybdopterin converting factor small subunit